MTQQTNHTVLWDGRKDGPGGAYLFGPEHPTVEPPPVRRVLDHTWTERMRRTREHLPEWFTRTEIAMLVGCSMERAIHTLGYLVSEGELEQAHHGHQRGRWQRYRWRTK